MPVIFWPDRRFTVGRTTDTQLRPAPPARVVPFERVEDFRDLGGYLTVSGERVRWRQLFRSGPLTNASVADRRAIRDDLGVRLEIDLSFHRVAIAAVAR